jgi:solute carrier family 29 (equilibrative nucleoside transporter), member 1/2/3
MACVLDLLVVGDSHVVGLVRLSCEACMSSSHVLILVKLNFAVDGIYLTKARPLLSRNMFLAAAPYFQVRFQSSAWALKYYQPTILSVSSITNLGSMLVLARLHKNASYPKRIILSLILYTVVFSLLAISTVVFTAVPEGVYFLFLMTMVFWSSLATGVNQNGVFSYALGFGTPEYTQAIMSGHGIGGVLPCIVPIISVLAVPKQSTDNPSSVPQVSSKSAFTYFITATVVSTLTLAAFLYLLRHAPSSTAKSPDDPDEEDEEVLSTNTQLKAAGLWTIFKKLYLTALAVSLCFAVTMVFPVFTTKIESVHKPVNRPRILDPATFIPLSFLLWNMGDLIGRSCVLIPQLRLVRLPFLLFVLSISRVVFIPLYMLCNVGGRGAVIQSDLFYLVIVQLLSGISNGYIGTCGMMSTGEYVSVEEREAAGGLMSMMPVVGLTIGSFFSFFAADS